MSRRLINKAGYTLLWLLTLAIGVGVGSLLLEKDARDSLQMEIPNLVGTWVGQNLTVSESKGYREWGEKTVHITEQKDRRFRGTFTYADGTKNFFGVIYPDNISFTWVSTPSKGFNHGRILGPDRIGACYVEAWTEATAGCAELVRQKE